MQSTIPYRTLGRTGVRVSAIGLGGWHLGLERVDEPLSVRIIRTAIDRGINFLDNCWDYNDGASETRMGKALRDGYRQKVFLMTKIDGRSYVEAMRQLDQSLERLRTSKRAPAAGFHVPVTQCHLTFFEPSLENRYDASPATTTVVQMSV